MGSVADPRRPAPGAPRRAPPRARVSRLLLRVGLLPGVPPGHRGRRGVRHGADGRADARGEPGAQGPSSRRRWRPTPSSPRTRRRVSTGSIAARPSATIGSVSIPSRASPSRIIRREFRQFNPLKSPGGAVKKTFFACVAILVVASSLLGREGPRREGQEEGPWRRRQHAACRRSDALLRPPRGNLALGRRLSRRPDARLRPARRPLHASDRRRGSPCPHHGAGLRHAAPLLPRRQDHRIHERPQRHRERLARRRRREEPARPDGREGHVRAHAGLDAGRHVRPRAQGRGEAGRHPAGGAVDVPPRGRGRHQADLHRRPQQRLGRRRVSRRALRLPVGAPGPLQLHARPLGRVSGRSSGSTARPASPSRSPPASAARCAPSCLPTARRSRS